MQKRKIIFGPKERESFYADYFGKYIQSVNNGNNYAGRLLKVEGEIAFLERYINKEFSPDGSFSWVIKDKILQIKIPSGRFETFQEITKGHLDGLVASLNQAIKNPPAQESKQNS
jgi:hypothetical protein